LVYSSGLSVVDTSASGIGVSVSRQGLGLGGGSAATSGTHQTQLSKSVAPPLKEPLTTYLIIIVVGFLVFFGGILFFLSTTGLALSWLAFCLAGTGFMLFRIYRHNTLATARFQVWQQTFFCLSCGARFIPTNVTVPPKAKKTA
jgi:hypothetical protein